MTVLIVSFVRILSTLTMTIHFSGVRANIIEGLAGGKVDLPCNMTSTPVDDKPVLVLWYKDKVLIPVYTFDARTGPLWQGRHSSSDHLTGRAYLTTVDRPAKLIIEPLMLQDHGSYRCRVDFNRTRTRYTDSILKVIVLPSKPLIKDKRGDILESLIGPYNEGESLKITCEVTGGIPVPSVSWWRETILLDDTATRKRMGPVINELTIPILKRHHLMATFSCVASNNNISAHLSTVVTVDMNFRPLVVEIVRSSQPFSAESPAQVKCWTAGSRPPAVIEWFKGNRQLKTASSNVSSHGNVTVSLLAFIPTVTDDEKPLSCSAMNPLIPDSTLTDTQTLDVRYKPQLNIIMTSRPNSFTAKEGGDVTLNCNIKAKPAVTTVNWVLEDQDLYTNLSAGVFVRNHTVLLASVDRSQSGIYKCVATNTQGMGKSAPFNLRIQYAPRCKENQMLVFGTTRHKPVKVPCEVEADPPEVTFKWIFNNSRESLDVVTFHSVVLKSVAIYIPRTKFDYGTLLCWASNAVGTQSYPCVFSVIPAGPPEKPRDCKVWNVTVNSVEITCKQGYNGGLKQHFVMEVHDETLHSLRANLTSSNPVFLLRGLDDGSMLKLVIYAVNVEGKSDRSIITINTISDWVRGAGDEWNVTSGPLLLIVGASMIVLLVIGLSLLLVLNIRSRKQGRPKTTTKNIIELQAVEEEDGSFFTKDSGNWLAPSLPNNISSCNKEDLLNIQRDGHCSRHLSESSALHSQVESKQTVKSSSIHCVRHRDSSYDRRGILLSEV